MKKTVNKAPVTKEEVEIIVDSKLEVLETRIDEKARGYRDEILTRLDGVMGELAQIRENGIFTDHDIKVLKEKSDGHEKRINKLETRQTP